MLAPPAVPRRRKTASQRRSLSGNGPPSLPGLACGTRPGLRHYEAGVEAEEAAGVKGGGGGEGGSEGGEGGGGSESGDGHSTRKRGGASDTKAGRGIRHESGDGHPTRRLSAWGIH